MKRIATMMILALGLLLLGAAGAEAQTPPRTTTLKLTWEYDAKLLAYVKEFRIEREQDDGSWARIATTATLPTETSPFILELSKGTAKLRVKAADEDGIESAASNVVTEEVVLPPLPGPTNLRRVAG
jgi:hypothetical protein